MPALNFLKIHVPKVEAKIKRCTIRKKRKDGRDPKAGQTLFLYTGMRSKSCRKLGEEVCISSEPIQIDGDNIVVAGQKLTPTEEHELAIADGFFYVTCFREFFWKPTGEQFEGFLITW